MTLYVNSFILIENFFGLGYGSWCLRLLQGNSWYWVRALLLEITVIDG